MSSSPRVSVVMPAHNVVPFLDDSIGSIIGQTFTDFEFVILDDGSTDGSAARLSDWAQRDRRIRLYRNTRPARPPYNSNFVVSQARSEIIARMDADDISHPDRLRRQLAVLDRRPDVAVVGALSIGIDAAGRAVRPRDAWRVLRRSSFVPFPHGSAMFRRSVFDEVGGYHEACGGWEEQDLFIRMSARGRVCVIPHVLYSYRYRAGSVTGTRPTAQAARTEQLRRRCVAEWRAGRDYGALLERPPDDVGRAAVRAALRAVASVHLWAGQRPRIFRRMLGRDAFEWSPQALFALAWAAWAGASPGSLRVVLRAFVRARDLLAMARLKDQEVWEWRLG